MSLLERLEGYRTKLSALAIGLLGLNELRPFLPEGAGKTILYLAGAAGLYFLREAVQGLSDKLNQN